MAKIKYFHVQHKVTQASHLVRAPRPSAAVSVIAGSKASLTQATDEEIEAYFTAGHQLHEKSVGKGEGKLFLNKVSPPVLIRAKNASAAFDALNDGSYDVKAVTQDELVELLGQGLKPLTFVDSAAGASSTPDGAGAAENAHAGSGDAIVTGDAANDGEVGGSDEAADAGEPAPAAGETSTDDTQVDESAAAHADAEAAVA